MTEWDQSHGRRVGHGDERAEWREGRDWRDASDAVRSDSRPGLAGDRVGPTGPSMRVRDLRDDRAQMSGRAPRDDQSPGYAAEASPYVPGGGAARGYGEGGDNAYGQMARGSSDSGLGGYGGADVGGWGEPNLNSQWGQGGYGPLNQGIDYGQDGGRFGPAGYASGDFGQHRPAAPRPAAAPHHDEHHVHYRGWRDAQLANHDRDYSNWRNEQARRYDEEYGSWRQERHAAFSKEFEGWRAGRGGQAAAVPAPPASGGATPGAAPASGASQTADPIHGANPTLAKIADGHEGRTRHPHDEKTSDDGGRDTST